MSRPGRPRQLERCILDRPIGSSMRTTCAKCKAFPLHRPEAASNGHGCSFLRHGEALCRRCAFIYDVGKLGNSRIRNEDWPTGPELFEMGLWASGM